MKKSSKREHISDADAEWKRFEAAKGQAVDQLKELYEKALEDVGEANAMIFEDPSDDAGRSGLCGVYQQYYLIPRAVNAEYAVATTGG